MHLSRLFIKNFRSIEEIDVRFTEGKNAIVGRNNAGKSNLIKAIDLVLGEYSPTWNRSENISISDFHSKKIPPANELKVAQEIVIICELTRSLGEQLNYEEINSSNGFYINGEVTEYYQSGKVKSRSPAPCLPNDDLKDLVEQIFEFKQDDEVGKIWVSNKIDNQVKFETILEDKHSFAFVFRAALVDGEIVKDLRFLFRPNSQSGWYLAFSAPIRNELLQSAIIPSFRDPATQLRLTKWSWFGKLIRHLTRGKEQSEEFIQALKQMQTVGDAVFSEVKTAVTQSSLNVAFPETEIFFQFNNDSAEELYKSCVIYVDDGFKSPLTEKGSGIQSATTIGLFNFYTQHVNTRSSALLCVEEPELYLHPHARRVVSDRLDTFLQQKKNQVILTTHSSEFIRTTSDDLNVISICKRKGETVTHSVNLRDYRDLIFDGNSTEFFFADGVILCEGNDEFLIRAVAHAFFVGQLDAHNISVIPVWSKDNLPRFAKLLRSLSIKTFVIADFDYLLRDRQVSKEEFPKVKAHGNVLELSNSFFADHNSDPRLSSQLISKITKTRDQIKASDRNAFYTAKTISEVKVTGIRELLDELSRSGCLILSGDIEFFCKDSSLLSDKGKFSKECAFKLQKKLSEGAQISDLFDCNEIADFLRSVFSTTEINNCR